MGIKDFFKKKKPKIEKAPEINLVLSDLKSGYYLDYDMKTWQVTSYNFYDWGSGDFTYEWQLTSADEVIYLEREPDDEDYWSVSTKISISRLNSEIKESIMDSGDPPDEITFENTTYYLEESSGGHFHKDGKTKSRKMLRWSYEDDSGEKFLGIEQWGEADFEASMGKKAEEYQFSDILPSATT